MIDKPDIERRHDGEAGSDATPRRGLLRGLLVRLGELALALLLVVAFFAVVLKIYSISFPEGTSLGSLIRREVGGRIGVGSEVDVQGLAAEGVPLLATLTRTEHTVKEKAATRIVWSDAQVGAALGEGHAVQTFEHSRATIAFGPASALNLGEKSLIVIRSAEQSPWSRNRRTELVILDGELSGKIGENSETPLLVEVAGGKSALRIDSGRGGAEFRATANPDESSTYVVFSGTAEVRAGDRAVSLSPNQTVTVDSSGRILTARNLAAAPALVEPIDGTQLTFRAAPPRVRFAWEPRSGAESYRIVLARDRDFVQVVHQAVLTESEFHHGNLKPGSYFWRVSSRVGSAESQPGQPRTLELRPDREAPPLRVEFPDAVIESDRFRLQGATEPGAEVFVGGVRVEISEDGTFQYEQSLDPGANNVVVEAIDAAGNTTYRTRLVRAKQVAQGRAL